VKDVVKVAWRSRMETRLHVAVQSKKDPLRNATFKLGNCFISTVLGDTGLEKFLVSTGSFHLLEVLEGTDCFYMKTSFRALHSSFRSRHRSSERHSMQYRDHQAQVIPHRFSSH
jgi:hypothetical protein